MDFLDESTIKNALSIAWVVYLVILAIWIVLQKRAPIATMGWILALAALPYVGFIIFYFFGPQKIERKRPSTKLFRHDIAQFEKLSQEAGLHPEDAPELAALITEVTKYPPSFATNYQLLTDDVMAFDSMFEAIENAKEYIHLEYYIFHPDHIGTRVRDLLTKKALEGVKVRVLLDALGARRVSRRFMKGLIKAGGKVAFFHDTSFRRFRPQLNFRTHRKILVCDGKIGFTGGMNITDDQDSRRIKHAYSDLHLKIEGQAAYRLNQIFVENWCYTCPEDRDQMNVQIPQVFGDHLVHVIPSGPNREEAPLLRAMLAAIYDARERIWLATPYFVPDQTTFLALSSAALRGVDVRIMLPKRSDSLLATLAARSWFGELLRAKVKVYEYAPRMLHSKSLLVDNKYSFVGTANFDTRSFYLNFELSVLSYDLRAARALETKFQHDLETCCSQVKMLPKRRGLLQRLPEALARLASPLL